MERVRRAAGEGTVGVVVAWVAVAGVTRGVSELTAGPSHGGRWDWPVVNALAWFGFLLVVAVGVMAVVAVVARFVRRRAGSRLPTG